MTTTFDTLTLDQVKRLVSPATGALGVNRALYLDDHWRNGAGWVGPLPPTDPELAAAAQALMAEIKRAFVSENVIAEGVDRHAGGVVGRSPNWTVTLVRGLATNESPTTQEQTLIDEADAALVAWWDSRDVHTLLQTFTSTLLWATVDAQRNEAALRLFIPPAYIKEGQVERAATLTEGLERLWVEHPAAGTGSTVRDPSTMRLAGVVSYPETPLGEDTAVTVYELTYIDEQGNTMVKTWRGDTMLPSDPLPLGGYLTHYVASRAPFFGESVRRLQATLNRSLSMMGHNENVAGFVERTVINADVPDGLSFGPLITNFLESLTVTDEKGVEHALPANVIYRDPASPDVFIKSQEAYRTAILRQMSQLHAVLSGDATTSGESRRQAMADYLRSLLATAIPVADAGRWLLTTALRLAAVLVGAPNKYDGLRIEFIPRLYIGPVSVDELRLIIDQVDAGILSQAEGMSRSQVDDPDAMKADIQMERAGDLSRRKQMADIIRTLLPPGAGVELQAAATFATASTEEVAALGAMAAAVTPPSDDTTATTDTTDDSETTDDSDTPTGEA